MSRVTRACWISALCLSCSVAGFGQTSASLATSDTILLLEAEPTAPRLVSLAVPGQPKWENATPETLIPFAEVSGKQFPLAWSFNRDASRIGDQLIAFVYDSASPRLRLTWEWRARAAFGPIEHQIRIENLGTQEVWIPLQDSLAFNWKIDPQSSLEHLFVEKGANTPSPVGTHQVALAYGYHWTGTSSTYGDLS
ncbi:MAG: alpha-galactosidase, partial [Candidatus Dormibacteraceae bacterium]